MKHSCCSISRHEVPARPTKCDRMLDSSRRFRCQAAPRRIWWWISGKGVLQHLEQFVRCYGHSLPPCTGRRKPLTCAGGGHRGTTLLPSSAYRRLWPDVSEAYSTAEVRTLAGLGLGLAHCASIGRALYDRGRTEARNPAFNAPKESSWRDLRQPRTGSLWWAPSRNSLRERGLRSTLHPNRQTSVLSGKVRRHAAQATNTGR
jgi:hypothetical protein